MRWIVGLFVAVIGVAAGYYWYAMPQSFPQKYILTADRVLTMDPEHPEVQGILVDGNEIMAVGDLRSLEDLANVEVVQLKGTLIPGLIEPHTHPITSALLGAAIDISSFKHDSRKQVIQTLRDSANSFNLTPWVLAYGWDPIAIEDLTPPTLAELDAISPDKPLLILTQMLHEAYANTAALTAAGIDPSHGPTLRELEEVNRVVSAVPAPPDEAVELLVRKQYADYAKAGYTSIGVPGAVGRHSNPVGLLQKIGLEDNPAVRTYVYLLEDQMPDWRFGGDDRFAILGVKLWLDGSPFTGGAATKEPYEVSELVQERLGLAVGHAGSLEISNEDLLMKLRKAHKNNGQVAFHTQGDRATEQALTAIEIVQTEDPRDDIHHRLEHNALITKEQIEKAAGLGVSLGFFVDHISYYGDQLVNLIGAERLERYLPVRHAQDAGAVVTFHGDHPTTPLDPLGTLETAMSRTSRSGKTVVGADHAVTLNEALKAMTLNAAMQLGQEDILGSVEVGKRADFTLLSGNPQVMKPEGLRLINPTLTIRNGQPIDTRFVSWFKAELALKALWRLMTGSKTPQPSS